VQACLHCVSAGWCDAILDDTVPSYKMASFTLIVSFMINFRTREKLTIGLGIGSGMGLCK